MTEQVHDNDLFFFSADDRQIDPSDPILRAVPSRGVVQQLRRPHPLPDSRPTDLNVLSALRANPGGVGTGGFPVSMGDDNGMLYSFTLPSTKPHPSKPPSVTESFGVLSTQVRGGWDARVGSYLYLSLSGVCTYCLFC